MCGIIGIVQYQNQSIPAAGKLLEGLGRLEYRGYDSAGIATINAKTGLIERARASGKLIHLAEKLQQDTPQGYIGIGHTRWATHGAANEDNAHPHASDMVAVVHNGIIENYRELRAECVKRGYEFHSQTDSEVIPAIITILMKKEGLAPLVAVQMALQKLHGAYAFACVFAHQPDLIIAARNGPPLAVGLGEGANLIGSDALAFGNECRKMLYLHDGEMAMLSGDNVQLYDATGQEITREALAVPLFSGATAKGEYRHFMRKEIEEQPGVVGETLKSFYDAQTGQMTAEHLPFDFTQLERVRLIGCGTSYYAGLCATYWFEQLAGISAHAEIASEFRYRKPLLNGKGREGCIFLSQSGETADTLASLQYTQPQGTPSLAIVNVGTSSLARAADSYFLTYAGPEIGVASTKAFTTQLATLASLALVCAGKRKHLPAQQLEEMAQSLMQAPARMADALHLEPAIIALAHTLIGVEHILYLGRGPSYAIALEGALKMKEISYIHADAYAAGELKHGPIALIDEHMPVIALAPNDAYLPKTLSNLQEVKARGGKLIVITDAAAEDEVGEIAHEMIVLPTAHPWIAPLLLSIPVQLLAYHVAVLKGTDVDQPRNLAKSVTVE